MLSRKPAAPATVVICAALPPADRQGSEPRRVLALPTDRPTRVPVTWLVDLRAISRAGFGSDRSDLALQLDPAWFASRQTLRAAVAEARAAAPGLEAAVLRKAPLQHRELLAEAGIRVVLVDAFDDIGRGSRRPAPQGWPCRNVAWGLWEVEAAARRPTGLRAWLPRLSSLPVARPGSLHVLVDRTVVPGGRGGASPRVDRWLAWAAARQSTGAAVAATLADLPALVAGRQRLPVGGSVLKAA